MGNFPIEYLKVEEFPRLLSEIPQIPKTLNYRGVLPAEGQKLLTVVGSRKYTNYGRDVVEYLISGLRGYNIGIVSGLALGIDGLAHQSALANNIYTLAIPGGGLSDQAIYPASHKPLARRILESGGGLLSEYEPDFTATNWSFPQRNRLVCGIADATLIVEASEKSGSLITARMATDYNREVLVVPGNIFSNNSKGTHQFLKLGATPITTPEDILDVLGLKVQDGVPPSKAIAPSLDEQKILDLLFEPLERNTLIRQSGLPTNVVSVILMQMEISGHIVESNGVYRKLVE